MLYRYNGLNAYTVHIPEYLKGRMRKLESFKQEYRTKFHRDPGPDEIKKALCISERSLWHLEKTLLNMRTRSLDEYLSDEGGAAVFWNCFQQMKRLMNWQAVVNTRGNYMRN